MGLPAQFKFTPLELFEWRRTMPDGEIRLIGQYHPGMTYNCTKEPIHDALREICKQWLADGKIKTRHKNISPKIPFKFVIVYGSV